MHHEIVYFSGRVQGVGFRLQAWQVARGFEVAGFVRNLPDGRVELEVEGTEREVTDFVAAVQERMSGHVRRTERISGRRPPRLAGFEIR